MTDRQLTVIENLDKRAEPATLAEMSGWMGCEPRDGMLTLGIMVRCNQLFRVGFVDHKSVWHLRARVT